MAETASIISDDILPQSDTKLTKTYGSEFGSLLWRHLTPQRKTAIWVHNCGLSRTQKPQRYFGKFTSCTSFGVHKLVHSKPFFGLPAQSFDNCCQRYVVSCRTKTLYRCTSTSSTLNYCNGILLKSFCYLYEVVCTIFLPISAVFAIFDPNNKKIVAPPGNENGNSLVDLKRQSLPRKRWKQNENPPINGDTILVQSMSSSNNSAPASECDKKNNKCTNTTFSHLQPACVVRSSPNFTWWRRTSRPLKRWDHFSIQRIVFPTGCTENFGLNDWHTVSQQ